MICEKRLCTGCQSCYNVCPKQAIKMKENDEGFLYPEIDEEKCIHCGLCKKVCPINNDTKDNELQEVYAAINKDEKILFDSSSGGMFTLIADSILKLDGYIYGCVFDENLKVIHIEINKEEDLEKMRGSKYVQSNVGDTFKLVKRRLSNEKYVLYVGTPCQIAGLKNFLGKEYEKLITIDLICHGVPSQKIFDKYIEYISKGKSITDFKFRDKNKNDINSQILSYKRNNKKLKIRNPELDPYYGAFYAGKIFRESCYVCKFANCNRVGDITLGDFWGVEKYHKELASKNGGVSACILNNKKAKDFFFFFFKKNIICYKSKIEYVKEKNLNLNGPTNKPKVRENIYKDLNLYGFDYINKKYLKPKNYIILKMKSYIPLKYKRLVLKYKYKLVK